MKLLKKSGKLVKKNGKLVRTDNPANCDCCGDPPPVQLWCCDGGTEGYFCGERVNVPGIGEMIGDAPIGICNSVKKVDDCSECGPPPPASCATCRLESASVTMSLPAYGKCPPINLQLTIPLTQGGNNWSGSVVNALPGVIRSTFSVRVICSDPSAASAVYGVSFDGSFRCADDFAIQILPLTSGVVPQMPCCGSGDQELRVLTFDSGFIQYPNATATIKLNCQKADNPLP